MSTPTWLIPDPDYLPQMPVGASAAIQVLLRVRAIPEYERTPTAPDGGDLGVWDPHYRMEIADALREILGEFGRQPIEARADAVDALLGLDPGAAAAALRVGETVSIAVQFTVTEIRRAQRAHPETGEMVTAYHYLVSLQASAELLAVFDGWVAGEHLVLAKGTDEWFALLAQGQAS